MQKSDIPKMPEYFDRYINLTDDLTFSEALQISLNELESLPIAKWEALGENVYAPGKWTTKDILQHLIDTERVFSYRITAFSRGDSQKMLAFDEDLYAQNANANRRTLEDLMAELILVRKNYIALYHSFTSEMLLKSGKGYNGSEYSVLAMAFMIPGHQRWHFKVVEERYFPLLELKSQLL
ncbi:DinB family protein [Flavobacterium sp.]|uniref:DinB family protein n=1 Tax=Flavobacterium sp. TaxID=239 RepID=UPI003D6BE06B